MCGAAELAGFRVLIHKYFSQVITLLIDGCYNYFLSSCQMATSYLSWKEFVTKHRNFCNKLKMMVLCNKLLTKVTVVEVLKQHQERAEHSWNKLHKWLTQLWDCAAPYRKHKLVCGYYKVVDKVNYNLVATLLQGCDNLVTTLWWPWNWNCSQTVTTLSQGCRNLVTRLLQGEKLNSIYGIAEVWWVVPYGVGYPYTTWLLWYVL